MKILKFGPHFKIMRRAVPGGTSVAGLSRGTRRRLPPSAAAYPSARSGGAGCANSPIPGNVGSASSSPAPVVASGLSRWSGGRIRGSSGPVLPAVTPQVKARVTSNRKVAGGRKRSAAELDNSIESSSPASTPSATPVNPAVQSFTPSNRSPPTGRGSQPSSEARQAAAADIIASFRGDGGLRRDDADGLDQQQDIEGEGGDGGAATPSVGCWGQRSKKNCVCTNPACRGNIWNGRDCGLQRCGGLEGKCVCFAEHRVPAPTKQHGNQVREILQILRPDDNEEDMNRFFQVNGKGLPLWKSLRIHTSHYPNEVKKWGKAGGKKGKDGDGKADRVIIQPGALPRYDPYIENETLLTQVGCCCL